MRATDRGWPTASGVMVSGKTTVSLSGRMGSTAGEAPTSSAGSRDRITKSVPAAARASGSSKPMPNLKGLKELS